MLRKKCIRHAKSNYTLTFISLIFVRINFKPYKNEFKRQFNTFFKTPIKIHLENRCQ